MRKHLFLWKPSAHTGSPRSGNLLAAVAAARELPQINCVDALELRIHDRRDAT
jgi:hypothetical protein